MSARAEALDHLVRGIVDNPDDVRVAEKSTRRGPLLEVRVSPDDLGRVIGRSRHGRGAGAGQQNGGERRLGLEVHGYPRPELG